MKLHYLIAPLLILLLQSTSCTPQDPQEPTAVANPSTVFPIKLGLKTTYQELALSDPEHQKGLMYRKSLKKDHGMLFLFEKARPQSFWMRNTPLPLDIGYFDASGHLLEVHKLYPHDETPVKSHSQGILIALEMEQGWYQANEIKPGTQIDLEALKTAIQKRGYSAEKYSFRED